MIDLTSTALEVSSTRRCDTEYSEFQAVKNELHRTKAQLEETVNQYESKLKNAEYVIGLLRDEIKAQVKDFKKDAFLEMRKEENVGSLKVEIKELRKEYEEKFKALQEEKMCIKCRAFLRISDSIQSKKNNYKYLY